MKYGFRPRDCPRAEPEGNPKGENHISWYVLTRVNVLTLYHYENRLLKNIVRSSEPYHEI